MRKVMRSFVFATVVALAGVLPAACGDDSAPEVTAPTVPTRVLNDTISETSSPAPVPSSPYTGSGNRESSDTTNTGG